jgi:hypothetical protein
MATPPRVPGGETADCRLQSHEHKVTLEHARTRYTRGNEWRSS